MQPYKDGMSPLAEIQAAVDILDRATDAGVDVGVARDRMRVRLVALRDGPPGAGWEWLAEQGERGALVVVEYERQRGREGT